MRNTQRIPLSTARASRQGRPRPSGRSWGVSKGLSTCHSASVKSMLLIYASLHNSQARAARRGGHCSPEKGRLCPKHRQKCHKFHLWPVLLREAMRMSDDENRNEGVRQSLAKEWTCITRSAAAGGLIDSGHVVIRLRTAGCSPAFPANPRSVSPNPS